VRFPLEDVVLQAMGRLPLVLKMKRDIKDRLPRLLIGLIRFLHK
jgi:hypothetical protein